MKAYLTSIVAASAIALSIGCNPPYNESRAEQMSRKQETVALEYSLDRENINNRLKLANDRHRIMWMYALSDYGQILFDCPVRGKATSSTKRLEPSTGNRGDLASESVVINGKNYYTQEIMGADGTYGSSDPYVFWFTPEGQYFQWNGKYILSSVPVRLSTPVMNLRDVDQEQLRKAHNAEKLLREGKEVTANLEQKLGGK